MGFFNKNNKNEEQSTTFNMSASELEQSFNEVDDSVVQQVNNNQSPIINNQGQVDASAVGNQVMNNTSPVQMMLSGTTQSSYNIPQSNIQVSDNTSSASTLMGEINGDYTTQFEDPTMQGLSNIFNPYVDSNGNAYSNTKASLFGSQFFGSDNNYYDEESASSQAYKNMSYDFESYLSFYNYVSSDAEDAGLDFADVSNIYEEMVQHNWMIPGYSPYTEVKDYKQYSKAIKSMGYSDEDVANSWNKVKTLKVSNDLQTYIGTSLGGTSEVQTLLGGDLNEVIKATQPNIYANMTYNGTADNPYAVAATGALGAYFNNMDFTNYGSAEEFLVDENVNQFTKTIVTNNYAEYIKSGQDPEQFLEQLPTQVVQTFTSNLVYDPKTNTATLYNYSPELTRFENLHDPEFWRNYIDNQEGWSNGLFTFKDGKAESLAEEYMTNPLANYLYASDYTSGVDTDNVNELIDATNSTFGTEIEYGDKNALENLAMTFRSTTEEQRLAGQELIVGSELGMLLDDVYSDSRVERMTSSQEVTHLLNTDGEDGFDFASPLHELGYGASYALNEFNNAITAEYENIKYSIKDGNHTKSSIIRDTASRGLDIVTKNTDSTLSDITGAVSDVINFSNHPLSLFKKNDFTDESLTSMMTSVNNGEMTVDDFTNTTVGNINKYTDIVTAMDNAKVDAMHAGDEAREQFQSDAYNELGDDANIIQKGGAFFKSNLGDITQIGDGAENARTEGYDTAFRKSLVEQLGEDTVSQMEEYGSLTKWANTDITGFVDDQKDSILKLAKSTMTDSEYEEWESDLYTDEDTKKARQLYKQANRQKLETQKNLLTPFIDNDRGEIDEGLNGYKKAYENHVDNTGEMNDLFFEIVLDPTTYITFGGDELALKGVKGLKAGLIGAGKGTSKTLTGKGNIVKNIAEETGESLRKSSAKKISKASKSKLKNSVFQDNVVRNSNRLKTMSRNLDELATNLSKDVLNDGADNFEAESFRALSDNLEDVKTSFANYHGKAKDLENNIKEASKRYRKFGFSRTEKEEAFELLKKHNADLNKLNDDLIEQVTNHQNAMGEVLSRTKDGGTLEARIKQYVNAYDGLLENNNIMRKQFTDNIKHGESLGTFIENSFNDMFRNNNSYRGVHGQMVINNLVDNIDGVMDDIMRYIHEDNLTSTDLSRMLEERLELSGKIKTKLPGAQRQVNNSIHDLVDFVDKKLVDKNRTFDRMSDIILNDDINDEMTDLALKNVGNRTSVKAKQVTIDDDIFNELIKQNGFMDDIKKIGNDYVRKQFVEGDSLDTTQALSEALHKQTIKYKNNILNMNKDLDSIQTTIGYFHDKDILFPMLEGKLNDLLVEHIPDYNEFLNANSGEMITALKRQLGLRDTLPNNQLVDAINDVNGFTKGDLSIQAIINGLDTPDLRGQLDTVLSAMERGDVDIDDELLNKLTASLNNKDIISLLESKFAYKGGTRKGKIGELPITKSQLSRMSKSAMVETIGKEGMFKLLKGSPNISYDKLIKRLSGSDIKRIMPSVYKQAEDALQLRQSAGLTKKVDNFEDILNSNTLAGDLSHMSYIEAVAPHAFQENIDILERIKELNYTVSNITNDVTNDEFALGRQGYNEIARAKRLGKLYKTGGMNVGDIARNNIPHLNFEGFITSMNKQYGTHKFTAMKDATDKLTEGMSNNILDTFTQSYNIDDYDKAVSGIMKAQGKTTQHVDTMTNIAQMTRKLAAVTGEKSRVHDNIRRAWNVVNNTIGASTTNALNLQKTLGTKVTKELDTLLHYKNHIISDSEMTTSEYQFFKNAFLDTGDNGRTQFMFSLDKDRMANMVKEIQSVEVPFGEEGQTFKLGEVFNISARTTDDLGYDDASHILDVSYNKDNKYIDDDTFKQTASFLRNSFVGDEDDVIDELGEKVTQTDVFNNIRDAFTPHMSNKFPDLFQRSGRINLIDSDSIKRINKNIDAKIENIKGYADKNTVTSYVKAYDKLMMKVEQQAYDTMYAMDNTGRLHADSELGSFAESMKKRRSGEGNGDDLTDVLIPEMRHRNMRTFINKKGSKKIGGTKHSNEEWSMFKSGSYNPNASIVKDASLKGSPQGKAHVLKETYGIDQSPIITDLRSIINNTSSQNMQAIIRAGYGNELHTFANGVIKNAEGRQLKKAPTFAGDVEVSMKELKNGLYKEQPNLYKKFAKNLRDEYKMNVGDDDIVTFDKRVFNQLESMGVQTRDLTDLSQMWKIAHKVQTFSQRMMLVGTFNTKAMLSSVPNLIMTPGGNALQSINSLYDTMSENAVFKYQMKQNPSGFFNALEEVGNLKSASYEQLEEIGRKHLKGKQLQAWNKRNKFSTLRNSSSTSHKTYGRYKKMARNPIDRIAMNQGSEATFKDIIGQVGKSTVDGIMPNSGVFDKAVLSRASYLVDNPNVLNRLLRANFSEELVDGYDMQDLASNAMRLAESEFGVTDGMLNRNRSKLDLIIPFRHQLVSGIPNILATFFGTPEGLLSTMQMQRRFNQIGAASAGMSQYEYNENLDDTDYGKLIIGGNIGDTTKLLTLNSYSPFDAINQFVGEGNTPMGVFWDSISPIAKFPIEMATGQDLGNYKINGSHAEKFHTARTTGDTKGAIEQMALGGLEATTGNLYRWANQSYKLASGKDNAGKQLMYFPSSTDAEINLVRSMLGQYGVSVKDGKIDEIPFMSTIFNSQNASEDVHTENLINALQQITYNETYMDALANEDLNPNGYAVRSGIYNTINKLSERAVVMSGVDLTKEYTKVLDAVRSGDNEALTQAYRDSKTAKISAGATFFEALDAMMKGQPE